MNIPKKLKVGGVTYKVEVTDTLYNGCNAEGEINFIQHIMRVRPGQDADVTFLHELVHAIFHLLCKEQDETLVEQLAQSLYAVIVDNKNIFADNNTKKREKS